MPFNQDGIKKFVQECNINIKGVLHVGSQNDGIKTLYNALNVHDNNIIWVESDLTKAANNKAKGFPNIFTTIIDQPDEIVEYIPSQDVPCDCSCSLCKDAPTLIITEVDNMKMLNLNDFMRHNNFDPAEFNIWNFDTMGSEYRIFKGAENLLKHADIIYTGVNSTEITKKNNRNSEIDQLLRKNGLFRVETIKNEDNWCMALYVRI